MLGTDPSHLFGDGTLTYYLLPSGRNAIGYVDLLVLSCVFVLNENTIDKKTSFAAVRWWWKFCTHQVHYRCVDIISIRILVLLDFSRYKMNISI